MRRVEFKLSMPSNNSWNGKWSGEEKNFTIVKTLSNWERGRFGMAGDEDARGSWSYNFGDGWIARVDARIVPAGEQLKKSDGFCGYEWMVASIIADGGIYSELRPKPAAKVEAQP